MAEHRDDPILVDFDRAVTAMVSALTEPFREFLRRLHAEGRITNDEFAAVTTEAARLARDRELRDRVLAEASLPSRKPPPSRPH